MKIPEKIKIYIQNNTTKGHGALRSLIWLFGPASPRGRRLGGRGVPNNHSHVVAAV